MFPSLLMSAMAALAGQPATDTFVLTFEPEAAILTPKGYAAARDAVAFFDSRPDFSQSDLTVPYLWVTDCRDGYEVRGLESAAEEELIALGFNPSRFFRPNPAKGADPCDQRAAGQREVLVGFRRHDGMWLSHLDMPRIFFATGSAELSAPSIWAIRRARASVGPDTWVLITGHTDTAEDGWTELGQVRGQAVRDAFVRLGVPDWQMRVEDGGEALLARATADGVSEPFNRRVQVQIFRTDEAERRPSWWFDQRDTAAAR